MATYEEICAEYRAHLRKGYEIQAEANKFLWREPSRLLNYDAAVYGPEAMAAAFTRRWEWEAQLLDIYRRELAARDADPPDS